MNAHFANRRALTLFWRYYAVLYEHCHTACVAHARAELRIRQRLRLFGFGSQSRLFPLCADEGYERSGAIAGNRRQASKIVELGSGGSAATRYPLSQKPYFRIAGRWSPLREVTVFQSVCLDSNFRKRIVRLNSFIRRHHGRNDCHGLGRNLLRPRKRPSEPVGRHLTAQLLPGQPDHLPCSPIPQSQRRFHDRLDRSPQTCSAATTGRTSRRTRRGLASTRHKHQLNSCRRYNRSGVSAWPAEG
jgi:hypothetical protein